MHFDIDLNELEHDSYRAGYMYLQYTRLLSLVSKTVSTTFKHVMAPRPPTPRVLTSGWML